MLHATQALRSGFRWNRTATRIELGLVLLLAGGFALWLQPVPHSDWEYYWKAAGSPLRYERGGVGLWLLAIPKSLGLSPVVSALLLNLASAGLLFALAHRADRTRGRWFTHLVALHLLVITPYFGIAQLDLVAAAQVGLGLHLLLRTSPGIGPSARALLAGASLAAGVSTRPQYALTLLAFVCLLACLWPFLRRRWHPAVPVLMAVAAGAVLLGFGLDAGLRHVSGRDEALRTSSAVTLYSGLLVSPLQHCGYWSPEAARAARADLGQPLHQAIRQRLAARPAAHWAAVLECKLPDILRPRPYALYWLMESPNVRESVGLHAGSARIDAAYDGARRVERVVYDLLLLATFAAVVLTSIRTGALAPSLWYVAPAWILSFWAVHLIFEIQGRYFLGMLLLIPLLCAHSAHRPPHAKGQGIVGQRSQAALSPR